MALDELGKADPLSRSSFHFQRPVGAEVTHFMNQSRHACRAYLCQRVRQHGPTNLRQILRHSSAIFPLVLTGGDDLVPEFQGHE
jgi:hypothetical protein